MARSFAGIASLPYQGQPNPLQGFACMQPRKPPAYIPLYIDWNVYWQALNNPSSVAVKVDLNAQPGVQNNVDRIISVRIDNTGSTVPIYIYFPDTTYTVTCPPGEITVEPVMTGQMTMTVIAQGLTAGFIPVTTIFAANYMLAYDNEEEIQYAFTQYLGSQSSQRSNLVTPGFAPPALGDQSQSIIQAVTPGGSFRLFGSPYASGFITLTHVVFNVTNLAVMANPINVFIESTGASGILFQTIFFNPGSAQPPFFNVLNMGGMQLKLRATETWQVRWPTNTISGSFSFIFNYTQNNTQ